MRKGLAVLFLILLCSAYSASAQNIIVRGRFGPDSAKIGERVPFYFSAHYPASEAIVFPDSTYSFTPFELERKKFFPTKTVNGISADSAIYLLTTFETDSVQTLRLPVFVLHRGDSTPVYSSYDTLLIQQLIKQVPESVAGKDLPLKTNADYINVSWLLNYELLLIIGGILVIVLVVLWIIFGKRIRKYFRLKRLEKRHQEFIQRFTRYIEILRTETSVPAAEAAVLDWKKYMETLIDKPFTKLTTKEILTLNHNETLGSALQQVDRMIYARNKQFPETAFETMQYYTQAEFSRIKEEVKNG